MSTSRAGSPRLAIASIAAARTLQSLSDPAFASAWPLRGSGSPANSRAAAARVGAVLLFFQACRALREQGRKYVLRWRAYLPRKRFSLPRAGRSISGGARGALRREVLRAKPMDARTDERSSRDSPKHDSTACDRNRWRARPTENTDAPIQTGKIPR